MNSAQRKFLIEKIQSKVKERIEVLKKQRMEYPSASNYLFKAIMNNTLFLKSTEDILDAIKRKALAAKEGENWLSNERIGFNKENTITLPWESLIVVPEDFLVERQRVEALNSAINKEIKELQIQLDTIEIRIQLASDKTLQKLVNEVDDMGSLSLIDTKLKLLS
jgi:hypothetical protein